MKRTERILANVLEGLLACCFLTIFALVVTQVFLRYALNTSITGANEIIVILFVYTTSIGGALAAGRSEHISLTFATETLPENMRRMMDRLSLLLVALINGVMVWFSMHWIGVTGDSLMPSTGLARSVAQFSIPTGCGLAAIYCLVKAFSPQEHPPSAAS